MKLTITQEMEKYIEQWWKKPLGEITDDDAVEIVEEFVGKEVAYAWLSTENEIYYTLEEEEEEEEENTVKPAWTEEYLNTLGMSLKDFF